MPPSNSFPWPTPLGRGGAPPPWYTEHVYSREWNPPNRFDPTTIEWDEEAPKARLEILEDRTKGVLSHNDSPDIGFSWSLNPYRGCTHACAYCYARPFHEFLGMG